MPVLPRPTRPCLARRFAGLVGVLLAVTFAAAQPADPPKAADRAAVKLPDGTIVFLTKSPDEVNPPIEGVYLSPQEYAALVEKSEQLKRLKDAPRPQAPSECQVRGKIEPRGGRSVAALSLTYSFRTTTPKAAVALGCQKAFPLAAKLDGGKLPALTAGDDGLTALVTTPGEHTLTLDVEAPVGPRGGKAEVGFDIGLPRAAITTLSLAAPDGVKKVTVGVRTAADKGGEPKRTTEDAAALGKYPLGPAELLEVAWQPPTAAPMAPEAALAAEVDAAVRVEETQVETIATVRLRGPAREWALVLPPGADVEARRAALATPRDPTAEPPFASASPGLTRPASPTQTHWTFRPPEPAGSDWDLTVTVRHPRPKTDAANKSPFAIGPFAVPTAARLTGTVKVYAPPNLRLSFTPAADVRRQDAPPPEENLAAVFKFTAVGPVSKSPPKELLKVLAQPARTYTRVQPTYTLRRTETGWRLSVEAVVTPVRTEVEQVQVELPTGWQSLEAGPLELVESVEEAEPSGTGRHYRVRLVAPQKATFTLTLTAAYPLPDPAATREATLPLLRFREADETGAKLTASVPESWEVKGTATGTDGSVRELKPANPSARPSTAVTSVTGQFEKGITRAQLNWQPYHPELATDLRADVTLGDGQLGVRQTIRFRSADGEVKPIRLRGPASVVGLRSVPGSLPVDPVGPGEWALRPPADGAREFTLSVTYALPAPSRQSGSAKLTLGLIWPIDATRAEATVRVFGGSSARRIARFEGPWRELPPEPVPERDSLPCLTLAGTATGTPTLPLTLELTEPIDGGIPAEVERALIQAWQSDDGTLAIRGRFRLRRWSPAGVEVELPPGVTADISLDGKHVEPAPPTGEPGGPRVVRVPVPEPRAGRSVLLDVRYLLPVVRPSALGELTITPPRLPGAAFRSPARWQIILPPDGVPLYLGRELQPDVRWGVRRGMPTPVAAASTEELDQWMTDGTDPDADGDLTAASAPSGDALTARQASPGPVRLFRFGRTRFAAVCSLVALALGLAVSRLRPGLIGLALGVAGVAAAVLAAGWPQPVAQAVAAAVPGVIGLAVVLGALAAVRWYYRRRVEYLPGFTRATAPAPSTPGSAIPTGPRSSPPGSGVAAIDAPTGSQPQAAPSGS